jgi:dTDP-4-amino-4,6-dideoxygalactose transaminase
LTNIQAAIGVAQTEMIDEKVAKKRWIGRTYNELLAGRSDLTLPYEEALAKNVYWMYGILLEKSFGVGKDDLMKKLKNMGVETRSLSNAQLLCTDPVFRISGDYQVLPIQESRTLPAIRHWVNSAQMEEKSPKS